MKQYFTGFFTAVCLTASVFLFMGAQNKNLGDVTVKSLRVEDDEGNPMVIIDSFEKGGGITVWNKNISIVADISVSDNSGGIIKTYNADFKKTIFLGTGDEGVGGGHFSAYNRHGTLTSYLGSSTKGIGLLKTYNADGKDMCYLGPGKSGNGSGGLIISNVNGKESSYFGEYLETYNDAGVKTGYFGTSKDRDGIAVLMDRYGDAGWSASGKK